jgi:hypothetical protein
MAMKDRDHRGAIDSGRSPFTIAALLLGAYVAMYWIVAGVVHALTTLDVSGAMARDRSPAPAAAAAAPQLTSAGQRREFDQPHAAHAPFEGDDDDASISRRR